VAKEALYWDKLCENRVRCRLCPHECLIDSGKRGICKVRENREGTLVSLSYGKVSSAALDPVEKKPLFHVEPGSLLLSIGSYGCNFGCEFCQNWHISQENPSFTELSPREIIDSATQSKKRDSRVVGIAYTYNEPSIWYEFIQECSYLAKDKGLRNILVTNGYMSSKPLGELLPLLDAINIDVKAFSEDFYKEIVHGRLGPVKKSVEIASQSTWVEITYLVIPNHNDSPEMVSEMARWLASINPAIPIHLSRYFPNYLMDAPATPISTLENLREIAREYLNYVYIGNAWRRGYADTRCPSCDSVLIERGVLEIERSYVSQDEKCPRCSRPLEVLGEIRI
jgi:pyruvate formate lyase activating enzyme